MTFSAALASVVGFTILVALIDRRLGKNQEPTPGAVHYGHADVDDHEYEDPRVPRHRPA